MLAQEARAAPRGGAIPVDVRSCDYHVHGPGIECAISKKRKRESADARSFASQRQKELSDAIGLTDRSKKDSATASSVSSRREANPKLRQPPAVVQSIEDAEGVDDLTVVVPNAAPSTKPALTATTTTTNATTSKAGSNPHRPHATKSAPWPRSSSSSSSHTAQKY